MTTLSTKANLATPLYTELFEHFGVSDTSSLIPDGSDLPSARLIAAAPAYPDLFLDEVLGLSEGEFILHMLQS